MPQLIVQQPPPSTAHRGDGKRFVVHAHEKLTAFLELEFPQFLGNGPTNQKGSGSPQPSPAVLVAKRAALAQKPHGESLLRYGFLMYASWSWAVFQRLIPTGERSGLQTHIATCKILTSNPAFQGDLREKKSSRRRMESSSRKLSKQNRER
jgi:hypothetical protein